MVETLIMVLGVIAGFSLLKVKEHRRIAVVNLNNKVQLIAVALIIFIMGINLGSMEDFAHKMLTMGLQSLVFAIIPTVFSVIIVYIFSKLFIVKNLNSKRRFVDGLYCIMCIDFRNYFWSICT